MACPFFMPIEKLEGGAFLHPARLPLGGGWTGHCAAPGHEGEIPAYDVIHDSCNLGYASKCSWLPAQRSWDAVRFAVTAEPNSASVSANGESAPNRPIRLRYVCERDHRPMAHGMLEFDLSGGGWTIRHSDERVQKMAECFLESYLNKRKQHDA
jgi:hypothetical protein